jgi:hypothetical protein
MRALRGLVAPMAATSTSEARESGFLEIPA